MWVLDFCLIYGIRRFSLVVNVIKSICVILIHCHLKFAKLKVKFLHSKKSSCFLFNKFELLELCKSTESYTNTVVWICHRLIVNRDREQIMHTDQITAFSIQISLLTSVQLPYLQKAALGTVFTAIVEIDFSVGHAPMKQALLSTGLMLASQTASSWNPSLTRHLTARRLTPVPHVTEHWKHTRECQNSEH